MAEPEQSEQMHRRHHLYWVENLKLIAVLLTIWALVSVVCCVLLIDTLNKVQIGSIPLGF